MEGRNCYADEHYLPTLFHVGTSYSVQLFRLKTTQVLPFLCYELFVLFRWLIQLELQIGLSHMPIGLKESGIQKRIGHKIFPLSSLRVLQYVHISYSLIVLLALDTFAYDDCCSLQSIDETFHITSDEQVQTSFIASEKMFCFKGKYLTYHYIHLLLQKKVTIMPCMWNGMKRPCYLFARKFNPEALDKLVFLFVNYTTV